MHSKNYWLNALLVCNENLFSTSYGIEFAQKSEIYRLFGHCSTRLHHTYKKVHLLRKLLTRRIHGSSFQRYSTILIIDIIMAVKPVCYTFVRNDLMSQLL